MNLKRKSGKGKMFSLKFLIYDIIKWTGAPSALLFIRPSVRYVNKESVRSLSGGYIISSNHLQFLDPVILHCAFPLRRIFIIAMEKMFETPLKAWFFRSINCIEVNRENTGVETIRESCDVLKDGRVLCIFPEGQISRSEEIAAFRPGCAMISLLSGAPVLPVRLVKRKSIWKCTRIIVGEPVYPEDVLGEDKSIMGIEKLNRVLYEKEQELCRYENDKEK